MAISDAKDLLDIADKLGIIQAVKGKLVKQPDPAADKLVTALEELSKIHTDVEKELVDYLSLSFDSSDKSVIAEQRSMLLNLEGEKLRARIAESHTSCAKISNVYDRYLNPWFEKVLNKEENQKMEKLFFDISNTRSGMVIGTIRLAEWISQKATDTLDRVDEEDFNFANKIIRDARKEIMPLRKSISDALSKLQALKGEMIEISGAL
jgi:hypothetical protein